MARQTNPFLRVALWLLVLVLIVGAAFVDHKYGGVRTPPANQTPVEIVIPNASSPT